MLTLQALTFIVVNVRHDVSHLELPNTGTLTSIEMLQPKLTDTTQL